MTDVATAMQNFWGGFEIPAYLENNVPDKAKQPYITYTLQQDYWMDDGMQQVRVWYLGESLAAINAKLDEIREAIGEAVSLPLPNGLIVIAPGSPFIQFQPADEINQKIAYINLDVQYLTR